MRRGRACTLVFVFGLRSGFCKPHVDNKVLLFLGDLSALCSAQAKAYAAFGGSSSLRLQQEGVHVPSHDTVPFAFE